MKAYLLIFCVGFLFSSCKKESNKYDRQTIRISNKSNGNWESIYVYSVVRDNISDSLIIKNVSQSRDTVVVWEDIATANEDAWFDFKVILSNKKELNGSGGERDDLPYSKITLNMDLAIYQDSVKVNSY